MMNDSMTIMLPMMVTSDVEPASKLNTTSCSTSEYKSLGIHTSAARLMHTHGAGLGSIHGAGISLFNQPATQGQLSLPSLRGRLGRQRQV